VRFILVAVCVLATAYVALRFVPGAAPLDDDLFPGRHPLVIAHRGGMGLWPEHTLYAFRSALAAGTDVLEMDVRRSADGQLVVFHDADLDRTTDGEGSLSAWNRSDLALLDAGYRFSADGGRTFPYRGRGLRIPTLEEVFRELPGARMSVEIKEEAEDVAHALCALVETHGVVDRVLVSSFHQAPIDAFRARCPSVATAATPGEAFRFTLASVLGLPNLVQPRGAALHMFESLGPYRLVTPRFVSHAAALNLPIYVWGVNDAEAIRRLIDAGVSGITTDRPDQVLALLGRLRGAPEAAPAP